MNFYGKNVNEFTDLEKKLVKVDTQLITSMMMNLEDKKLLTIDTDQKTNTMSGTHEDIGEKHELRTKIVCEILGIENPNEDSIFDEIEKTQYSLQNFGIELSKEMDGEPFDVLYHYVEKVKQEELVEG